MKQIVAWVDSAEKKSLIEANKNNYPIFFSKNRKDFIQKINSSVKRFFRYYSFHPFLLSS